MSKVKIFSIVPYTVLPAKMGGEKGIALFNEYLGQEAELTAIGTEGNDITLAKTYQFLRVFPNSRTRYGNLFLFFKVKKLLKESGAQHFIIEHPYYGWLAWMLRMATNAKWIVHSHNIEYQRSRSIGRKWWPALKWYEKWVYRQADTVFFISDDDRTYAVNSFGLKSEKTHTITYGIEIAAAPSSKPAFKKTIAHRHGFDEQDRILLFNGALYQNSNYEALDIILEKINPVLEKAGSPYKILICGKGLPDRYQELKGYANHNIVYPGFVEDISEYFKAADIFLNPIMTGGGVKTKAIEAIAYGCKVISTQFGAMGIEAEVCGDQLVKLEDGNWTLFATTTVNSLTETSTTPASFYEHYYWGNIAKKVVRIISTIPHG